MNFAIFGLPALGTLAIFALAPVAFAAPAPGAVDGQQLFRARCQVCHAIAPGVASPVGPHLGGVVGRKAGSTTFAYSPAMKNAKVVWTKANLNRYLLGPNKMIPGVRMVITVPEASVRAAIIAYLAGGR